MQQYRNTLFLKSNLKTQRGQALLMLLVILIIAGSATFYTFIDKSVSTVERDKLTTAALAQAKLALIGYAVGVSNLAGNERPGDLPCPDTNDSGAAGTPNCNAQALRIGRLPWKTLGLPDLRDGDGERLWYAVSNNFKNNGRTSCLNPGDAGCLNSDARGTITVRDTLGNVIHDGTNPDAFTPSGVIAVIFAPGAVLQRQDTGTPQNRSCAGGSCTAAGVCTSSPLTNTPKCNPVNYLDILNGVEDNADFTDSSNSNGVINGVIRDTSGNVIVNDRLLVITYQDLMPLLERRVAKEVLNCLTTYASVAQNNGRYPWAVPVGNYPSFADQVDTRFGRVPDNPLSATQLGVAGGVADASCPASPTVCMSTNWPITCGITQGSWWTNWKDIVFYGLANAYKPTDPVLGGGVPASSGCSGTNCLLVNPPSAAVNKRVAVVVAGKRLSGQPRTSSADKGNAANYLEATNVNTATSYTYEVQPFSATFNDFLLYQ